MHQFLAAPCDAIRCESLQGACSLVVDQEIINQYLTIYDFTATLAKQSVNNVSVILASEVEVMRFPCHFCRYAWLLGWNKNDAAVSSLAKSA